MTEEEFAVLALGLRKHSIVSTVFLNKISDEVRIETRNVNGRQHPGNFDRGVVGFDNTILESCGFRPKAMTSEYFIWIVRAEQFAGFCQCFEHDSIATRISKL